MWPRLLMLSVLCVIVSVSSKEHCKLTPGNKEIRCANLSNTYLPTEYFFAYNDDVHNVTSQLKRLEVTRSNISTLVRGNFKGMPLLSLISLPHISLKTIEHGAFSGIQRLKSLDLSHNLLENILPDTFLSTGLGHLNLEGNVLLTMPTNGPLFQAKKLIWLSLKNCRIQHLPGSAFQLTPMITYLDLSHNHLAMLPQHIFTPFLHLTHLDLSENKFQTIDFTMFQAVQQFPALPREVLLSGNSWSCPCSMAGVIEWMNQDTSSKTAQGWAESVVKSRQRKAVYCSSPAEYAGKEWFELRDMVFHC